MLELIFLTIVVGAVIFIVLMSEPGPGHGNIKSYSNFNSYSGSNSIDEAGIARIEHYEKVRSDYNQSKIYPNSFDQPQIVTGDHYTYSCIGEDKMYYYYRCLHAGSASCANCARRSEHNYGNKYAYGMSDSCKSSMVISDDNEYDGIL